MVRPKKQRMIKHPPPFRKFKPAGIPGKVVESIILSIDEYEAIRLADYEGFSHAESAEKMCVSRSTFSRLIEIARKKFAKLIVEGKSLDIEGGDIHFYRDSITCQNCGHIFNDEISGKKTSCPQCGSSDIIRHAEQLGHGQCCHRFNRQTGSYKS
ncbi:MAG: DUF134 domain-containing protein [bacterium]